MSAGLNPSRVELSNGVTLITKHTQKTPAVTIDIAIRCGATVDPVSAPGAAYLLSRVVDRGTASRSATDIAEALDDRGISLGLSVSRRLFSLTCTCLADDFESVLALIGDIVMAPTVPEDELDTRRRHVLTGLRQDEDNPAARASDAFMEMLFGTEHPYGRPVKGTAASVHALTRQHLLDLHTARFGPKALTLVVVGDAAPSRMEDSANRVFGSWRHPAIPPDPVEPVRPSNGRRLSVVPMMNKSQAEIAYGFPSIARHDPAYFAYLLMNNVLGQYAMAGRLGDSIRERQGLAYSVWSSFDASTIPGPMVIRAGVAGENVDRTIDSIDEELRTLRESGVSGRELAETRQSIVGSLPRSLETNAGIASFLQNAAFFGLGLDYDQRLPMLLTMPTIDEVNAAAQSLDPARATIAVAGPYEPA